MVCTQNSANSFPVRCSTSQSRNYHIEIPLPNLHVSLKISVFSYYTFLLIIHIIIKYKVINLIMYILSGYCYCILY